MAWRESRLQFIERGRERIAEEERPVLRLQDAIDGIGINGDVGRE
jgi:hypothetical protein